MVVTEEWHCCKARGMELDGEGAATMTGQEEGEKQGWVSVGGAELRRYWIELCEVACHCRVGGGPRRSER